jgi:hypothetical protein
VIVNSADVMTSRSSLAVRPRRFFFVFGVALLIVVLVGFAPTFFLRGVIDFAGSAALPAAPGYVYIHGALMTSWYVLFVVQAGLIAGGRREIHRWLGAAGLVLAAAIVPMGWLTTERSAARIGALTGFTPEQLIEIFHLDAALLRGLIGLGLFAGCVAAAALQRRHAATHGRLMLLAGIAASGAALAPTRIIGAAAGTVLPPWLLGESVFMAAAVLALVAYDWRSLRRLHAATMIVGTALLLQVPLASAFAATAAGQTWFRDLFALGQS